LLILIFEREECKKAQIPDPLMILHVFEVFFVDICMMCVCVFCMGGLILYLKER